jgi:tannase
MSSLADICTVAKVQAALPANGTLSGINLLPSTVTANALYNVTSSGPGGVMKRADASGSTYCNVTVSYQHTGANDNVVLWYTFPAPDAFQNRLYMAGGGGYTLSTNDPTGGLEYGAVSGSSDVGYGGFDSVTLDEVVLNGNGSLNWDNINMFSYQAWGETTLVGQYITKALYGLGDSKLYTYFEGCSDGGREAMSQAQRYGELYDGIVAGAPAFHHAQQQVVCVYRISFFFFFFFFFWFSWQVSSSCNNGETERQTKHPMFQRQSNFWSEVGFESRTERESPFYIVMWISREGGAMCMKNI